MRVTITDSTYKGRTGTATAMSATLYSVKLDRAEGGRRTVYVSAEFVAPEGSPIAPYVAR